MKGLIFKLVSIIVCVLSLSSCATMTRWFDSNEKNHKMYTVCIDSKTRGLPVYCIENGNERLLGFTPCKVYSDKAMIKYVTVRNGEEYQMVKLKTKPRKSAYWNFVPWPGYNWSWGFFLDKGTRRGLTYSQKEYYVDF